MAVGLLVTLPVAGALAPAGQFVTDLVACIKAQAEQIAATREVWGDRCYAPASKIAWQAERNKRTLTPLMENHGYSAALWCAIYSAQMVSGKAYKPYADWTARLLCPWDLKNCGNEALDLHGPERNGVPAEWAGDQARDARFGEVQQTMSCGLCGHLARTFGAPPFTAATPVTRAAATTKRLDTMRDEGNGWWNEWDMHAFGVWLANDAAERQTAPLTVLDQIVKWRVTDGEEIHGYLWHSATLLGQAAAAAGTVSAVEIEAHVLALCQTTWAPDAQRSTQTRWDCSHAAGHAYFGYWQDVGKALTSCWSDAIVQLTPFWLEPKALLMWRWLCATGVYHHAAASLTLQTLQSVATDETRSELTAHELLCMRPGSLGKHTPQFDRCAGVAGLGIEEAELRLGFVRAGMCDESKHYGAVTEEDAKARQAAGMEVGANDDLVDGGDDGRLKEIWSPLRVVEPAAWETAAVAGKQVMQRSCNTDNVFAAVNDNCPAAWKAVWECDSADNAARADRALCDTLWHEHCADDDLRRLAFICQATPHRAGMDDVVDGTDDGVGVWGGTCTCPATGATYLVGDGADACATLSCVDGEPGKCVHKVSAWAYRKLLGLGGEGGVQNPHRAEMALMIVLLPLGLCCCVTLLCCVGCCCIARRRRGKRGSKVRGDNDMEEEMQMALEAEDLEDELELLDQMEAMEMYNVHMERSGGSRHGGGGGSRRSSRARR